MRIKRNPTEEVIMSHAEYEKLMDLLVLLQTSNAIYGPWIASLQAENVVLHSSIRQYWNSVNREFAALLIENNSLKNDAVSKQGHLNHLTSCYETQIATLNTVIENYKNNCRELNNANNFLNTHHEEVEVEFDIRLNECSEKIKTLKEEIKRQQDSFQVVSGCNASTQTDECARTRDFFSIWHQQGTATVSSSDLTSPSITLQQKLTL